MAYATLGFKVCFSNALEDGKEKLALYGIDRNGRILPTHAALQLESGSWTSKIGDCEDVEHTNPEDVNGPIYGRPLVYMERLRPSTNI